MSATPYDPVITAWKQQVDAALGAVEAVTEGARKIHETQLEAACEAHACAEATRKKLAAASDPNELWRIQADWLAANLQASLAYWRNFYETVAETDANVARCLCPSLETPAGLPAVPPASKVALAGMLDQAYKQWLETTRQFYAPHAN
jgi:phasin family protein